MSGVGKVPESVNKRSVTRLTQNPNHDEEVNVRDNSSVDLVQVQRGISDTPAEVLIQSNTHNSPAAELVQVNDGSQGGGESSDGEGDVEIEHIGDEGVQSQHVDGYGHSHQIHSPNIPVTFDVRKRTLISMWQRSILEELYKNGMTSASLQLGHLHATAVERTGLDIVVVKNWIRNRRRPTAVRSAEKLAEKMAVGSMPQSIPALTSVSTVAPPLTPITISSHGHNTHAHHQTYSSTTIPGCHAQPPDPKRICIDSGSQVHQHSHPPPVQVHPQHHSSQTHSHPVVVSINHISSATSPTLLVKVRVFGSGESDFIEVEVPALSYSALLNSCCEELDISSSEVTKIRKLPNVLIRKDKDVQRLKEGQELEIVLKTENSTITSMLTVNPFSVPGNIPLLNLHTSSGGMIRNDTENSIIAALANEVPTSMHEMGDSGGGHNTHAHQVNGLH